MHLPPLLHVPRVLQHSAAPLTALPHVVDLVSDFLDVSTCFSIPTAGSSTSTLLMERVVMRVTSNHSLSPALLSYWFGQAFEAAIKNNDLAMVQKIHVLHPVPLDAYSLELAMEHGSLEMVQWVIEHRHDRLCCTPGLKNLCELCLRRAISSLGKQDAVRVVQWLAQQGAIQLAPDDDAFLWHPLMQCVELVEWCYDRGLISSAIGNRLLERLMVIIDADVHTLTIARYLVARGFTLTRQQLLHYLVSMTCDRRREAMAAFLVSSPLCDSIRHWFEYAPTQPGGAKVLQWSRKIMDDPANAGFVDDIVRYAGIGFHFDTMRWLYEERGRIPVFYVRYEPAQELLRYYEWRLSLGLDVGTQRDVERAAHNGYLDVVEWLHTHTTVEFTTDVMNAAASGGHLAVVEWLHDNSPVGCTTTAMDCAASGGHLDVVKWLHRNRTEGCTHWALEQAALNGHLETVQWLCENRSEQNPTTAMMNAAMDGQLHVLQWLFENQEDACAACALKDVVQCCDDCPPVHVLRWLCGLPPRASCTGRCGGRLPGRYWLGNAAVAFGDRELLEFVMEHFPETEPPGELLRITDPATSLVKKVHTGILACIRARQRGTCEQG